MAHFSGANFYHPTRLSPIYKPKPLLLPCNPCNSGFQAFLCPPTPHFRFSSLFFEALHLQQPSLTFKDLPDSTGGALLFQLVFSLLWLPKGAHPHLWGLFLRPTSIRSTSTSLRQPNMHPFHLLPIGNAFAYLSHSFGPWILDSGVSDLLSGNKDLFSSLTIISPLPMIKMDLKPRLKESIQHVIFLPYPLLLSFMFLIVLLIQFISVS